MLAAQPSSSPDEPLKVLTGNPHLAVERAARRFGFELGRLALDGALCPVRLAAAIGDASVVAVYAQTLSYTDGIADDLPAILAVIEKENLRRASAARRGAPASLVHLINDSCLAFCALVHNDGALTLTLVLALSRTLTLSLTLTLTLTLILTLTPTLTPTLTVTLSLALTVTMTLARRVLLGYRAAQPPAQKLGLGLG